jgi:excisionase family DNA binding protein
MKILLTESQAAERLGVRERTLREWRAKGISPKWLRMGRFVHYRAEDVSAWIESRVQGGCDV